jgi:hypothetical protein
VSRLLESADVPSGSPGEKPLLVSKKAPIPLARPEWQRNSKSIGNNQIKARRFGKFESSRCIVAYGRLVGPPA